MSRKMEALRKQLEREAERKAQAEKRMKQIQKTLKTEKRRTENRRKYIAGGYFLRQLLEGKPPCGSYEELLQVLDQELIEDNDRLAFDLPLFPDEVKKSKRAQSKKAKQKTSSNVTTNHSLEQSGSGQKRRTTLPSALTESLENEVAAPQVPAAAYAGNDRTSSSNRRPVNPAPHIAASAITGGRLPEADESTLKAGFNLPPSES